MEVILLIAVLCLSSISFTAAQNEESLEISPNVYSGRPNPVWSIARPTDPTKSAKFDKLVTLLMKLPEPPVAPAVGGYDGFAIKHIMDAGKTHTIRIAKCSYLDLETALLETAPKHMDPSQLSQSMIDHIQTTIDTCRLNSAAAKTGPQ